jgi:hypothetical protein
MLTPYLVASIWRLASYSFATCAGAFFFSIEEGVLHHLGEV